MAIEGKLGSGGAADLLAALWHSERTGLVDLVAGGVDRKLALQDGAIVYLTSTDPSERLPVRLVASGVGTREQIIKASQQGADLRTALQGLGCDVAAHDRVLEQLVRDVVAKIFPLTAGSWSLMDRAELGLPGVLDDLDMTPVLWSAARACPAEFAAGFVGPPSSRLMRTGHDDVLQQLSDLSPQEGFLVSRIDGYGSVSDLMAVLPLPQEQVLRLVVGLTCVGYVEVQGRPGIKLPRPAKTTGKRKKAAPPAGAKPVAASLQSRAGTIAVSAPAEPASDMEGIDAARALHAKIKDADYYGVLGLAAAADEDEVRRAYYKHARSFHPDRFGRDLAGRDRELVEDLFGRISEAFQTLSNAEKRQEYDQRLKSGALAAEKEKEKPVDRKDLARGSFEKGKALAAAGDRARALTFFEHAAETDPDHWEYRIGLARLLMTESRLRKRAEQQLQEAIRIDQTKAEAYYLLGMLYKLGGVKSRALEQFREGLKWDAGHAGIAKELGEMGEDGGGAGLRGLFKKK